MEVSVLLLTFNEAINLPRCLAAIAWCDDIIVVDSGSTDETVAIAERAGARIFHRRFDDFANQRNFGLEFGAPRHEWVLHLDADEVITPAFRTRLAALQPLDGIDAFGVPSKIMLHGHWLRYAGTYPAFQVRLGHRDRLRFIQVGHGQRENLPPCRVGVFDEPYLHFNFSQGLAAWLRKHVRYAQEEADLLVSVRAGRAGARPKVAAGSTERRRALKRLASCLPLGLRPIARFLYIFVRRRGFLDGRYGFIYALMLSVYEGMIAIFAAERALEQSELSARGDDNRGM